MLFCVVYFTRRNRNDACSRRGYTGCYCGGAHVVYDHDDCASVSSVASTHMGGVRNCTPGNNICVRGYEILSNVGEIDLGDV